MHQDYALPKATVALVSIASFNLLLLSIHSFLPLSHNSLIPCLVSLTDILINLGRSCDDCSSY